MDTFDKYNQEIKTGLTDNQQRHQEPSCKPICCPYPHLVNEIHTLPKLHLTRQMKQHRKILRSVLRGKAI